MPSFFPSMNAFPPTPPHVTVGGRPDVDAPPYYPAGQTVYPMKYPAGCEGFENYPPSTCYPNRGPVAAYSHSLHPEHATRDICASKPSVSQRGTAQGIYGSHSASFGLPPIRSNTKLPPMDTAIPSQYRRQEPSVQQEQRSKEQKSTGGVAAYLDYEMDQMVDFVAEMAQGMYALYASKISLADIDIIRSVYPGTTVPPQFRKYVSQILSSTRLPCSTILLGLYYLASRMRMLSAADVYETGTGQVYRMLTTALLLGSKFLDDNTFQNRSWSEVSNIPVAELNSMELEWLFAFDWKIHNRLHNKHDGLLTWKGHWDVWRAKFEARMHEPRVKLAPIDTNIQRQYSMPKVLLSPEGPIPPQYQRGSWLTPSTSDYSPPSAPHTGPNTPDYYQVAPWPYNNPPPPYTRNWVMPQQFVPPTTRSQPPSYQPTPYAQPFSPTHMWTGHGAACGCMYCAKSTEHYLPSMSFNLQPVAG